MKKNTKTTNAKVKKQVNRKPRLWGLATTNPYQEFWTSRFVHNLYATREAAEADAKMLNECGYFPNERIAAVKGPCFYTIKNDLKKGQR